MTHITLLQTNLFSCNPSAYSPCPFVTLATMGIKVMLVCKAILYFPRMLPGHEKAAELLLERALDTLAQKGVTHIVGQVTTMHPNSVQMAEKMGFSLTNWGYKVYYSYEMKWGRLKIRNELAEEVDLENDLEGCANIAAHWYGRSPKWCRAHLQKWARVDPITHLCIRDRGKIIAGCMAAPNNVRPSIAAIFYIYTPNEASLQSLLSKVVDNCIQYGSQNVIANLVNEHRPFEPIYQELGFNKVAEWARCEKVLI